MRDLDKLHQEIENTIAIPQTNALTREQCSLCTANRPRLCDQHYKQGADELLKHVTAAIQDQQTPGGVKATYEQLLELCNQQRQALTQQAQEVERLTKRVKELEGYLHMFRTPEESMLYMANRIAQQEKDIEIVKHGRDLAWADRDDLARQLAAMTAELEEYRSLAEKVGATKAVSERDEWRSKEQALHKAIEQLSPALTASEQEAGRLRDILAAILAADERGQGLPFQEAMQEAQWALDEAKKKA